METLKELVDKGLNYSEIAKILGIHRTTVAKKIKKEGLFKQKEKSNKCLICNNPSTSRRNRCDSCNTKIRRYRAKKASVEYKGGCCEKCGWKGNLAAFDFHHKDPNKKDFNPSAVELANKSWVEVKKELDKCVLLCAICHRIEHNDYENEKFLEIAKQENVDLIFKN
jgi:hypothetical protein